MKRKSLFFRLEEPTEEQLDAEIEEFFTSLSLSLKDFTVADFIAAAKIFFAPVTHKALTRTLIENRAFEKATEARQQKVAEEKEAALAIAARLLAQHPELRGARKASQLAEKVREELAKRGKPKSVRVLRRWFANQPPKK